MTVAEDIEKESLGGTRRIAGFLWQPRKKQIRLKQV